MTDQTQNNEFEVLGFKVKLRPNEEGNHSVKSVVDLVRRESNKIRENAPLLDNGQLAILTALKIASDKLDLQKDYKESVEYFKNNTMDIHHLMEQISSSTISPPSSEQA